MYMLLTCRDLGSNNYAENLRTLGVQQAMEVAQRGHRMKTRRTKILSRLRKSRAVTEVTEDEEKPYEDNVTAMIQECEETDPNRKVNTLSRIFVE